MNKIFFVLIAFLLSIKTWADLPPLPSSQDKSTEQESVKDEKSSTEEKPSRPTHGPHNGNLISAASFNIEILWENDLAKFYLLDSDFNNPVVQGSEVGVFIKSGNTESEMSCAPVEDYFECKQSGKKFKKGQLAISAKRSGVPAEEIKVDVPFAGKADLKTASESKKGKETKKKK